MSDYLREHVFDEPMLSRQRLLWAIATRRQLERWEPYVARDVAELHAGRQLPGIDVWAAQIEHHLLLVAARNMLGALDVKPKSRIKIDKKVRTDLIGGRGIVEHWRENWYAFTSYPRAEPPHPSARKWAERNPRSGPFDWLDRTSAEGALVLPSVPADTLHGIVDAVEGEAVAARPSLASYIPPARRRRGFVRTGGGFQRTSRPRRRVTPMSRDDAERRGTQRNDSAQRAGSGSRKAPSGSLETLCKPEVAGSIPARSIVRRSEFSRANSRSRGSLKLGGQAAEVAAKAVATSSMRQADLRTNLALAQYSRPASTRGLRPHANVFSYQPVIGASVVPKRDECTNQSFPT